MLGQATGNLDSPDSPRPGLGGSHHLLPYTILCASPWGPRPNGFLSRDSQVGVPKLPRLGLLQIWGAITLRTDLRWRWGPKQSFSHHRELSNGMSHNTCTQGNRVKFWLLIVETQIVNLTLNPFFGHNLCYRCPNGWCEPILDIEVPGAFQWYKELFKPLSFDPYNHPLKIRESTRIQIPNVGVPLGVWGSIPSHSLALPGAYDMAPRLFSWPTTLQPLALVASPKLKLQHKPFEKRHKLFEKEGSHPCYWLHSHTSSWFAKLYIVVMYPFSSKYVKP